MSINKLTSCLACCADMKVLGQLAFLLLLGGIWCQNNRNAKASSKSTKRSGGNQGGEVGQSPPEVDLTPGNTGGTGNNRGTGGTAASRRESTAGARAAGQQTDDMRLLFLKNTQVTCNDGTAAGWDVLAHFCTYFFYWNPKQEMHSCNIHHLLSGCLIWEATEESYLFVVLQVLHKGVQRKPPMAVISGRWVFKNPTG